MKPETIKNRRVPTASYIHKNRLKLSQLAERSQRCGRIKSQNSDKKYFYKDERMNGAYIINNRQHIVQDAFGVYFNTIDELVNITGSFDLDFKDFIKKYYQKSMEFLDFDIDYFNSRYKELSKDKTFKGVLVKITDYYINAEYLYYVVNSFKDPALFYANEAKRIREFYIYITDRFGDGEGVILPIKFKAGPGEAFAVINLTGN